MPVLLSRLIGAGAIFCLGCRAATRLPSKGPRSFVGIWVISASLVELVAIGLILAHTRNMLLYNINWVAEFGLLVLIGQLMNPWPRWLLVLMIVLFMSIWGLDMLTVDPLSTLVKRSVISGSLLLTAFYLWQFWRTANECPGRLLDVPEAWYCLTVLVYYGACGPLLGSYNYFVLVDKGLARTILSLTQVACILKFILMGVTLLKMRTATRPVNEHA